MFAKNSAAGCLLLLMSLGSAAHSAEIPTAKPEDVGMSAAALAKIDTVMADLVRDKKLAGGIVLVARHGKIVYFQSSGLMDIEANKPMTNDAILRFYSMTKAITTAAALALCEDGKLGLDDPVSKHLPELKALKVASDKVASDAADQTPEREMTIRDLMRHTAGLSYGSSGNAKADQAFGAAKVLDPDTTLATMTEKVGKLPLAFAPGKDWCYGISTDVLGRVCEVASGQPLDAFLQQRILGPLDMLDTAFFVPSDKLPRFAANYTSDGKGKLTLLDDPAKSRYLQSPKLLSGGGGLVSTARDYLRFLLMVAQGGELDGVRILKQDTVALMRTNQLPAEVGSIKFGKEVREGVGFGLGFCVRDKMSSFDPNGRLGEYGWGGAASTHYWVSPKDDLIVIVLEQTMPYSFLTEFALKGLIYEAVGK